MSQFWGKDWNVEAKDDRHSFYDFRVRKNQGGSCKRSMHLTWCWLAISLKIQSQIHIALVWNHFWRSILIFMLLRFHEIFTQLCTFAIWLWHENLVKTQLHKNNNAPPQHWFSPFVPDLAKKFRPVSAFFSDPVIVTGPQCKIEDSIDLITGIYSNKKGKS